MLWYKRSLNIAGGNSLRHSARRGSLDPVSNLCASNAATFTNSVCSPTDLKSTFDYYAVFRATAKIDLAGVLTGRGEKNRERLFWFQRREKLHCSYSGEMRLIAPLNQRREHFVEDYYSRDKRRAGKMPRQTGMIGADYTANFKGHARYVAARWNQAIERVVCSCSTGVNMAKLNRRQYGAKAWSTSSAEEPNCDRWYRWFADCLSVCLATSARMRCSAPDDIDQPK